MSGTREVVREANSIALARQPEGPLRARAERFPPTPPSPQSGGRLRPAAGGAGTYKSQRPRHEGQAIVRFAKLRGHAVPPSSGRKAPFPR